MLASSSDNTHTHTLTHIVMLASNASSPLCMGWQGTIESFVFWEGDLTSWTVARKLQQAQCWRAAQIAASFPGTKQWGFYHREVALKSRSEKIATVDTLCSGVCIVLWGSTHTRTSTHMRAETHAQNTHIHTNTHAHTHSHTLTLTHTQSCCS